MTTPDMTPKAWVRAYVAWAKDDSAGYDQVHDLLDEALLLIHSLDEQLSACRKVNLGLEASAANVRAAIAIEQKATQRAEAAEAEVKRLREERPALFAAGFYARPAGAANASSDSWVQYEVDGTRRAWTFSPGGSATDLQSTAWDAYHAQEAK